MLDDYREEQLPVLLSQKTKDLADKAKSMNDLAKAAKAVGATVKTSDLVGATGQVPDFGAVGQVAPQLFDMSVGAISGPINAGRTGVVAKIVDKQEPTADEIAKNFDQTRDADARPEARQDAFSVFVSERYGTTTRSTSWSASTPRRRTAGAGPCKTRTRSGKTKGPQPRGCGPFCCVRRQRQSAQAGGGDGQSRRGRMVGLGVEVRRDRTHAWE